MAQLAPCDDGQNVSLKRHEAGTRDWKPYRRLVSSDSKTATSRKDSYLLLRFTLLKVGNGRVFESEYLICSYIICWPGKEEVLTLP